MVSKVRLLSHFSLAVALDRYICSRVPTWQLVEALSLLCVIVRCDDAKANVVSVFGKMGPIELREDGVVRYLWAQQTLHGEKSALRGRPDIIVTSSSERPHPDNAVRIIDAKCARNLGATVIRGEFGKAHDLRVASYFIWSDDLASMISLCFHQMPSNFDSLYLNGILSTTYVHSSDASDKNTVAR